jgi:hypothetical protein
MTGVCQTEYIKSVGCNYRPNANGGNTTLLLFSEKEERVLTGCDIAVYRMSSIIIYREDKCIEERRKTI